MQFTGDPFIWIPNCVGFLLGSLQLALCAIYPRDARYFKALPPCALPAPALPVFRGLGCRDEGTVRRPPPRCPVLQSSPALRLPCLPCLVQGLQCRVGCGVPGHVHACAWPGRVHKGTHLRCVLFW